MMQIKKIISAVLIFPALLFCCGCASFYASKYPNDEYAPTSPSMIPIYNNYPPVPYEIIGEVGGNGAPLSSWQGMGKRLREYAAQMGGDAVVIAEQATPYVGTLTTPTTISTTSSAYGSTTGSASIYGNNIYGQAYGQSYGQSQTVINPGTSTPMYGKEVKAYVIKYKNSSSTSSNIKRFPLKDKQGRLAGYVVDHSDGVYEIIYPNGQRTGYIQNGKLFDNNGKFVADASRAEEKYKNYFK